MIQNNNPTLTESYFSLFGTLPQNAPILLPHVQQKRVNYRDVYEAVEDRMTTWETVSELAEHLYYWKLDFSDDYEIACHINESVYEARRGFEASLHVARVYFDIS